MRPICSYNYPICSRVSAGIGIVISFISVNYTLTDELLVTRCFGQELGLTSTSVLALSGCAGAGRL